MHLQRGLDSVELGHRDIHHHHVRAQLQHLLHRLASVRRDGCHTHVGLRVQQHAQSVAHNAVIIHHDYLDHYLQFQSVVRWFGVACRVHACWCLLT
jgi:hypothetical protein